MIKCFQQWNDYERFARRNALIECLAHRTATFSPSVSEVIHLIETLPAHIEPLPAQIDTLPELTET